MVRRSKMPVCGNGIVEVGEDCDCGLNKVIYLLLKHTRLNKIKRYEFNFKFSRVMSYLSKLI